jgi:hypothetical protein
MMQHNSRLASWWGSFAVAIETQLSMALQQAVWLFITFPHSFKMFVMLGKTSGQTEPSNKTKG